MVERHHQPSSLELWFRRCGFRSKANDDPERLTTRFYEREESRPEEVFELTDEEIARFVAALWDCDGHMSERAVT